MILPGLNLASDPARINEICLCRFCLSRLEYFIHCDEHGKRALSQVSLAHRLCIFGSRFLLEHRRYPFA